MKVFQWIILGMVALLTTSIVQAQDTIEVSNDSTFIVIEEKATPDTVYMSDDQLFNTVKEYNEANYIEVNSFMLGMAKMMAPREEKAFLDKIKSMRIINLAACSAADKERFAEFISTVELSSFEPAVNHGSDVNKNEKLRIYIKIKGKNITDLIVAGCGERECQLLQLTGKMSLSDLEAMTNNKGQSAM